MKHYRLSPNVHVELFDEEAIFFVADRDVMVTVNQAAAELYEAAQHSLKHQPFTRSECRDFLLENYDLSAEEAEEEALSLLSFGLRNRVVVKGGHIGVSNDGPSMSSPAWRSPRSERTGERCSCGA